MLAILFDQHAHVPYMQLNRAFSTPSDVPLVHNNCAFATSADIVPTGIITTIVMLHGYDAGFIRRALGITISGSVLYCLIMSLHKLFFQELT